MSTYKRIYVMSNIPGRNNIKHVTEILTRSRPGATITVRTVHSAIKTHCTSFDVGVETLSTDVGDFIWAIIYL